MLFSRSSILSLCLVISYHLFIFDSHDMTVWHGVFLIICRVVYDVYTENKSAIKFTINDEWQMFIKLKNCSWSRKEWIKQSIRLLSYFLCLSLSRSKTQLNCYCFRIDVCGIDNRVHKVPLRISGVVSYKERFSITSKSTNPINLS